MTANLNGDTLDSPKLTDTDSTKTISEASKVTSPEKRITFTLSTDSSPEGSQTLSPKKFDSIAEEETVIPEGEVDEVILRPRLIDRHPHLLPSAALGTTPRKILRSAKSVPHFNVRAAASETDIFSITGSGNTISMTPEVPSISFSNLPKNYEDTPTIEKYRVSQSLYSIQTANEAKLNSVDYSMPRYFRKSAMISQSTEILASGNVTPSTTSSREDVRRPEKEKSKRLQMLRGALPPLLIHSVSFRKTRDESKQVD
ncbi:hypothetical protein CVS40_10522 [Lucilia cuprina]|nr:hypothetical protein CVS40_10522 [Lucilia cuprina]